jgi:hypothetical protein
VRDNENKGVGERGRNRTFNLLIKSQLLCQLSYAPGRVSRLPRMAIQDSGESVRFAHA